MVELLVVQASSKRTRMWRCVMTAIPPQATIDGEPSRFQSHITDLIAALFFSQVTDFVAARRWPLWVDSTLQTPVPSSRRGNDRVQQPCQYHTAPSDSSWPLSAPSRVKPPAAPFSRWLRRQQRLHLYRVPRDALLSAIPGPSSTRSRASAEASGCAHQCRVGGQYWRGRHSPLTSVCIALSNQNSGDNFRLGPCTIELAARDGITTGRGDAPLATLTL